MGLPEQRQRVYAETVDKNSGSGIINSGNKLAMSGNGNVLDYDIEENIQSVNELKTYISEQFNIKYIKGVDKLKNGTCAKKY